MPPKGKSTPLRHHVLNRSAAAAVKASKTSSKAAAENGAGQRSTQELEELQGNEIMALESILASDFRIVDLEAQSPWKSLASPTKDNAPTSPSPVTQQHAFEIVIRPDTDTLKALVSVKVRFRLPRRYPALPPIITVVPESARGLDENHLKQLQDHLTALSRDLVGSSDAMIFELYNHGQDYISSHNTEFGRLEAGPSRSLDEEKQERDQERLRAEAERAQEEQERHLREERERAEKIAKLVQEQSDKNTATIAEGQSRKKRGAGLEYTPPSTPDNDLHRQYQSSPSAGENSALSPMQATDAASMRRIETFMDKLEWNGMSTNRIAVGPVLEKGVISSTYAVEAVESSSGGCWHMESYGIASRHYNLSSGKRRLEEVEWELDKLRTLRSDCLVNVLGAALVAQQDQRQEGSALSNTPTKCLNVVKEAHEGPSAALLLSYGIQMPWARARDYLLHILTGLEALHDRNIIHRDVSARNVLLTDGRDGKARARLARAGYAQRMLDLNAESPLVDRDAQPTPQRRSPPEWEAPETQDESDPSRKRQYSRKRDVWDAGVVALQMLTGLDVAERYASPAALLSADEGQLAALGPHVTMLLAAMLDPSTRKRPAASEVRARLEECISFEDDELGAASETVFAGRNTKEDVKQSVANIRKPLLRTTSERDDPFRPGSFWQLNRGTQRGAVGAGASSRYGDDFEELNLLGKGAYGAVYKARNRLDGREYAIKKIRLSSSPENDEKTLREITALSRLSHQNIVRYVTCWIEVQQGVADSAMSSSITSDTHTSSLKASSLDFRLPGINDDFLSAGHDAFSHGASNVFFGHSDSESDSDSDEESSQQRPGSRLVTNGQRQGASAIAAQVLSSADSDSDSDASSDATQSNIASEVQRDGNIASDSLSSSQVLSNQVRWLYIQMEYVENETLKEAIDEGLSIDEAWRLFRQLVEALAHVASLGIIHRDLKPSNVLMYGRDSGEEGGDAQGHTGSIKIGDFGLATTTPTQAGDGASTFTAEDVTDQTNDIGTSLYIAPEVLRAGETRYDSKVDIYACGIVFFEMLASQRVYKTGMERINVIRELRTPEICFPAGWNEAELSAQTKLLRRMLDHDPAERPTPLEILKSDLLPPKMEDEYIAECMRLLSMPNSTYNLQLMDSLFERHDSYEQREARDLTFDAGSNEGGQAGLDNRFVAVAAQHLRGLFRLRGAVEMEAPLLLPPNDLYDDDKNRPVELLDKTGKVVQLPFDLVMPFARMIARGQQQRLKRFAIAHVYRPNLLAGGQPRSVDEVDYDIVAPERTSAAEAEVLSVIDEIIEEIPGLNSDEWVIHISHAAILDLLLERVPASLRQPALSAIALFASGNKTATAQGRQQLFNLGLTRSILEEIESANISDDVDTVFRKLETLIAYDLRPRLHRAVDEIRDVVSAAQQFGVQRRLQFTPLLIGNMPFYKDAVYFVVVRARGKRRDVLASGGRYDALLRRFANPTVVRPPSHAVGVQIALGRIAVALARHYETSGGLSSSSAQARLGGEEERTYGPFTPRRCEVYVASAPGLLSVRMDICRELWAANVSADLAYEHALEESPELLASTCRAEGIQYLVIARSRGSMLKIKAVLSRTEHEVHRWELTSWLLDRLHRLRSGIDSSGGAALASGERPLQLAGSNGPISTPTGAHATMLQASDVEVLLPERYAYDKRKADKHGTSDTRRGRKQAYLGPMQENAARQVSKLTEELAQLSIAAPSSNTSNSQHRLPVVAVDVGPSSTAFHRLCGAALARTDEALWKVFMDSLSTADEREYGRTLRQRISEMQGRAWLVSIRSDGAVAMI